MKKRSVGIRSIQSSAKSMIFTKSMIFILPLFSFLLIVIMVGAVQVPNISTNMTIFSYNAYVRGGMPVVYVFNITNNDSSSYDEIRITVPFNNVTYASCNVPSVDWVCTPNSPTVNTTSFTTVVDAIAPGSSRLFNITATTNVQTGNITWQARGVNGGTVVSSLNFQTGIDSSAPVNYAASIMGKTENTWISGVSLSLNCVNATDSNSGINSTSFKYFFYNNSASENVMIGDGNSSILVWTFPSNFEQTPFNISCNATDLVQNSGSLDYAFYLGYDNVVPAVWGVEVNDSDRLVRGSWMLNFTVNATDRYLVNVTVSNLTSSSMSIASADSILGNYSLIANASSLCSNVGADKENPCLLIFRAYDNASNINATTLLLYVDDQPPRISFFGTNLSANVTKGGGEINFTTNITEFNISSVMLIGTSGNNITGLSKFASAGALTSWSAVNKTDDVCFGILNGPCTIRINATDVIGNWNDTLSMIVQIDNIPPNVTNPQASDAVVNQAQVIYINVSAVDNVVAVSIFNMSGSPSSAMLLQDSFGVFNITANATTLCGVSTGACALRFNATDGAGNWNDTTAFSLTIDADAPAVQFPNTNLTLPGNKTRSSWQINFSVNATDAGTAIMSIVLYNGSGAPVSALTRTNSDVWSVVNSTSQLCPGVSNGNCTLTFSAVDNASNINSTARIILTVDDTSYPSLNVTSPVNGAVYSTRNISIIYTVSDLILDTCRYTNATGGNISMAGCINITFLAVEGLNSIVVLVNNSGGYINQTFLNFTVDTMAPVINITAPLNASSLVNFNITFAFNATDANLNACWYNLDNSANTTISCYNQATFLAIPGGWHTLTVFANDTANNLNFSPVIFFTNSSAPSITVLSPVNNRTYNNSIIFVDVIFNSTPMWVNESIDGTISAICFGNCSALYSHNINMSDGNHSFTVMISDFFGNLVNSATINFTVLTPDTIPPNVTIISPIEGGIYDINPIAINISANETAQNISMRLDFGNITYMCWNCSSALNLSTIADGNHTIYATATDFANNSASKNVTFLIDTTFPVMYSVLPANGTYVGKNPNGTSSQQFNLTYTEQNVRQVVFYIKNSSAFVFNEINITCSSGNLKSCLYTPNLSALNIMNGDVVDFRFMIRDNTHYVYSNITRITIADVSSLTINLTSPINKTYNVSRIPLTVVLNKPAKQIARAVDNDFYSVLCSNCNTTNINLSYSQGWHTLKLRAYNYDDSYIYAESTFFVDSIAPNVFYISPLDNSYVSNITEFIIRYTEANPMNVTLVIKNNSGALMQKSLNCPWGSMQTCSDTVDLNAYNGMQVQFYFELNDGSFFVNTTQRTIFVDSTKPLITVASPQNTTYNSTRVEIKISASEAVYSIKMSIDSGSYLAVCSNCQSYSSNLSFIQGYHTVRFIAEDYSGNVDSKNATFLVDSISPSIISVLPGNKTYVNSYTNFTVKYTESNLRQAKLVIRNASDVVFESNISCGSGSSKICFTFVNLSAFEGKQLSYYFVLFDDKNNKTSATNSIFIDSIAPVISVASPVNTTYNTTIVNLNVSSNENLSSIKLAVDSMFFVKICTKCNSTSKRLYLNQGSHTIRVIGTDFAGNSNSAETTIIVDSIKPSILSYSPANKSYVKNTTTFSVRYSELNLDNAVLVIKNSTATIQSVAMNCDAGYFKLCNVDVDLSQYEGRTIYYYFNFSDDAFSVQTQLRTLYVDSTPPVLNVISPVDSSSYNKTVLFNMTTAEKVRNIGRAIDGGFFSVMCSNCNATKSSLYLSKGNHTAILRATDYAGNVVNIVKTFSVI